MVSIEGMIMGHRIALDPTVKQRIAFAKACGVARLAWNDALAEWIRQHKAGEKPTWRKLQKWWNAFKHQKYPFIKDSPKDANQRPFTNLGTAFQRFFKKQGGYPRFKQKGEHDSFYVSNTTFSCNDKVVRLPVIGDVRMTEALRFAGKIVSATVSREVDRWFISVQVEVGEVMKPRTANGVIGIDLGVKTALVTSDGQSFNAPMPLKRGLRKLKRLSRFHSRKHKGSNNRKKSQRRLARHHQRIKNIRRDWQHKVTTKLARENQTICLEDLNVCGMRATRAVRDIGFYEIRRQLGYKVPMHGGEVKAVDRYEPTSKRCSSCYRLKASLSLRTRVFVCEDVNCCNIMDRDRNASKNIRTAGLAGTHACGPVGSGATRQPRRVEAGTTPRRHHVLAR